MLLFCSTRHALPFQNFIRSRQQSAPAAVSRKEQVMSPPHAPFSYPRRKFLYATTGAAAIAISPWTKVALACAPAAPLRLGIVLPQSTRYPELPKQLLAGFEAYLAAAGGQAGGRAVELLPIACCSGARAAFAAAGEAVRSGGVDLLAGMVDRNLASQIAPLLEERGTPFVVSDLGADIVRKRRESAFLIRNSLGYWQTSYAMGQWAAAHFGKRALIASDFLESGYDMVYAFRRAFEAQGGEITAVQVTGLPDGSGDFSHVADAIRTQRPDFVYAFYSGKRAEAFLRFYDSERLSRIAALAGAGLLTDAVTSPDLPAGAKGVITASPWGADIASIENIGLQSAYRKVHGGDAGLFAMLGFETAQRIATGIAALDGNTADREQFARALASAEFVGPRGAVAAHDNMSDASAPVFVRRLSRSGDRLANVTIAQLPAVSLAADAGHALRTMIKSGWAQAYLAA
jgi:ABC-type branched-subunit amino acid transport system substrate-binding protein